MKKILSKPQTGQERLKVAKQIYVDIFKQTELHIDELLRKNNKTDSDYENLKFLDYIKEEVKLDHCFFIAWYLANKVNNDHGWYQLNLCLVGEVILILPLAKEHEIWKNLPLFEAIFPTYMGIQLKDFQDYFRFVKMSEVEQRLDITKPSYWVDPTDYDPDQFGIPFPTKGEDN